MKNLKILEKGLKKLRDHRYISRPDEKVENKPAPSGQDIQNAENDLGIALPVSYKAFLGKAGTCPLIFDEVFWVGSNGETYENIVDICEKEKAEGDSQDHLIPFFADGYGNYACFDTRKSREGEYSVVFWDHEEQLSEPGCEPEIIADSFAEWFLEEVEEQIEEDIGCEEDEE